LHKPEIAALPQAAMTRYGCDDERVGGSRAPLSSSRSAPPITYSFDGKQYVALLVGLGGAWPKWFVDSTEGLEKVEPSSRLYVFAL
jgi:hypothetical protein